MQGGRGGTLEKLEIQKTSNLNKGGRGIFDLIMVATLNYRR